MGFDVVCAGVMVADVLVQGADETVFTRDMTRVNAVRLCAGGDAMNQALDLAAMGVKVALMGRTGDDGAGAFLRDFAVRQGVDASFVRVASALPTSVTVVLIRPDGSRCFIGSAKGANSEISTDDFDARAFAGARIVSLGSLYGSASLGGDVAASILRAAKRAGCVTIADMMHGDRFPFSDACKALPYVDYFLPNEEEARLLTGCAEIDGIADALLRAGAGCVLVKRGAQGCFVKNSGLRLELPAFSADVIDTTGAGDALVSGFISGLLDGCEVEECARRGCAAGAIAVESLGANGAIRSKEQVLARAGSSSKKA